MAVLAEQERLLLILSNLPGLGGRGLAALLASGIPLRQLFMLPAEELSGRFGLTRRAAAAIAGGPEALRLRVAPLERLVCRYGIRLLRHGQPGYPRRLAHLDEAPPVLYAYGNLDLLDRPAVALLASTGERREDLECLAALASTFARAGATVVAGHNRPGYRAAVAAAKAVGGARCYVLDRGLAAAFGEDLDRDLFPTARVWGYGFDRERSLALSPFPLAAPFVGLHNRLRDRLVSSLASWVVAVAVRSGGVMEGECRAARARGTPVYVCASPAAPPGNRALLAEGYPALPEEPARIVNSEY